MRALRLFLPLFVFSLVLPGCVVWNFVATRYDNVTGFFNTYYNAVKLFDEAVAEIESQQQSLQTPLEPQFALDLPPAPAAGEAPSEEDQQRTAKAKEQVMKKEFGVPQSARDKLDRVIEKCSRLLVSYARSKWVDNALMLIGKSYYYKREYARAERKFNELIDGFPESPFLPEAVLWLGKIHADNERFDQAEKVLKRAIDLATEQEDAKTAAEAWYAMGEMYLAQGKSPEAVSSFQKGTEFAKDKDQRIRIQLALAKEQERLGNKREAARAYADIIRLEPSIDLMFIAELNYARLSRELGNVDEAVNTIVDMLENPSYLQYDAKIQLEIGHLYAAVEDYPTAIEQYTYVDSTFKNTPEASEAYLAQARLYEWKLNNYDKAYDNYTSAKITSPGSPSAMAAAKRSTIFEEYRKLRVKMADQDTLLFFVLHPDSLEARDRAQALADSLDRQKRKDAGETLLTEQQKNAERFSRRRPHGRNTGRINPYAEVAFDPKSSKEVPVPSLAGVSAKLPLYRKVNLRSMSADSVLGFLSVTRMDMGSMMFDKIGNVDSATYYYELAMQGKLPDSLYAQALYTLAQIERSRNRPEQVRTYEDQLLRRFPSTRFALIVMAQRGMELPKDSAAIRKEQYERAARLIETGAYAQGITALQGLVDTNPKTELAARSHLAMALTYETRLKDLKKALEIYRLMINLYPESRYAQRAKDVIAALEAPPPEKKKEQPKMEKAEPPKEPPKPKPEPALRPMQRLDMEESKRDSLRNKKSDPTQDPDFPLSLPGEKSTPPSPRPDQKGPEPKPRTK